MNTQTVSMLKEWADRLGTTAGHLWPSIVRYAVVRAATDLLTSLLFFAATLIALRWALRFKPTDAYSADDQKAFAVGAALVAFGIAFIILCCSLTNSLPAFFAPEAAALKMLFDSGHSK